MEKEEKEEEEEREVEVRALTGESTRVAVSANMTVNDLKKRISSSIGFPLALSSPNFHLFFKGVKLSLQSVIWKLDIGQDEFLILIPFIKKQRVEAPTSGFPANAPEDKLSPISKFADSAYLDMMQELSSVHDDNAMPNEQESYRFQCNKEMHSDKSDDNRKEEDALCGFLRSVMQSSSKNIIEQQNCKKFVEILESMSCLMNPESGKCVFYAGSATSDVGVNGDKLVSCLCPAWLKRIVEAFAFLNIFSAFICMQRKFVTSACLKEAIDQLNKYGFKAGFEDIEHLSVLFPTVVCFSDNCSKLPTLGNALVILNSNRDDEYETADVPQNARKLSRLSQIFNSMRKWQSYCKANLWEATEMLMSRGNAISTTFSFEDLLHFMKQTHVPSSGNGRKRVKSTSGANSNSCSFRSPCQDMNQLSPEEMVEHLRLGTGSRGQMVHVEDINARAAIFVEVPNNLSANTRYALKNLGISKLYSHQAESIMASLAGKSVVVATMTSSGKSLCYNVPILEALSQGASCCALYMFPTKALAQDQLRALLAMTEGLDSSIDIGIYDGDTSQKDRSWLRANARLLITNPDMLHMSILPYHRQFSRILTDLRFVVVDEAHTYKGAFGCHAALILRRLRRLCSHVYGSNPSFIFSTATSANPRQHCMELANLSTLELIQNDGSPSSRKLFVLWNPSSCLTTVTNKSKIEMDTSASTNRSLSPISEVSYLFAEMVRHGLRCIAFCRSRKLTELVLSYTREILKETAPDLVESICAYRAGYVPEDRRKIEKGFFSGKLRGIAATNALELGIDVGHVDATLHLGFPGSIASLWQQAGRSGRRERSSLAVYVAFESPLDQYFMKFPKKLFGGPIECCHIDAQNQQVLEQHLLCAAFEHPLSLLYDEAYFGPGLNNAVMSLKNKGKLISDPSLESSATIWSYIGHEKLPSHGICIRAVETVRYKVIDVQRNEIMEEIEESKAFFQVHEGAVFLHQGKTYLVKELDLSKKIALCQEADLKYYTKTRDYTDIHVPGSDMAYPARSFKNQLMRTTAQARSCNVTTVWFGFYRIQRGSNKILDAVELSLPKYSYQSQAVWIKVPQVIKESVEDKNLSFRGGLHAASHAVLNVVPLYVRCNSSDLAPECSNPHDTRYYPERILVYDQHPGGTGVSLQIQPYFTELLNAALELLTSCCCPGDTGCPNCVQSMVCHEYNEDIQKDAAIMIIKGVLDSEKAYLSEIP